MNNKLFAWVDLTKFLVGDHTWVSTYEPASGQPNPILGDYWYCWGSPHNNAQLIGVGIGGVDFAKSIAEPHDPADNVGVEYFHDGVCHQMANRLLRFSLDENKQPVKVTAAKGYRLSKIAYGEYGGELNRRNRGCWEKWSKVVSDYQNSLEEKNE